MATKNKVTTASKSKATVNATKSFVATSGETFKVDSKYASLVQEFGNVCYMSCGANEKRYLRGTGTNGKYLARAIAERAFGNINGKTVRFADGDSLNVTEKNLVVR